MQRKKQVAGLKNKIQKFSKGDFHNAHPDVIFQETNLVMIIGEGEVYRGSFSVKSQTEGNIRGLIYPSSFRVHFKDQGFEGNPARVEFTYDGRGLRPGHVEEGKFTVVCNGGEYELSFTAIIEKPYVMTSYGKVQSTDDFRKLAIKDYSEAGRLFRSREFYEILKYENERIFYLYDNMRKWSLGEQAMEEFLVGIKQKECIFLTLPGEGMLFEDIEESTKGTLTLMKNTWGFMPIKVEAEGRFIKVLRPELSTEDFVGNTYEVEYLVRPEELHGGRNFGALKFITPYETLIYEIEVLQNQDYDEDHRMKELLEAQILKGYVGYVAGRVELNNWVESAIEKMAALRKMDPQSETLQLLQAHIYVAGNKIEEAKWILENYNYNRFAIGKDPVTNCYYLYLTALIRGKGSHIDRVLDEIGKTYMRHQDSWPLLSMIINLDPRYRNPYKKIEVLEQQFSFEIHEVLFYLAAYECYQEKPTLLKKLGKFEIQVLNFASKYRLMTKELALYVANFASQQKNYSDAMFRILERIYKMYSETMILNTICTLLIKGNKTQQRYFEWYKRAVDAELKIAQLYEYYMVTIEEERVRGPLPKSIFLYFMHGNTLDYKKAAFLYANLITYEEEGSDLYLSYREQMVAFTWEQLEKRHITESLKILYKRFLREDEMTSERMEALHDICFAYEITTRVRNMNCVLVIEKDGNVRQRIPYDEEDGAVIFLYDKESRVVWESLEGRHYTDSIAYETKRLFYEPRFLDMYKKYAAHAGIWKHEEQKREATFDSIRELGTDAFDEKDIFRLCSKRIREDNYEEDEFLSFLCFELFKKEQYDKVTLTYLANYYCGATSDMKRLWKVLREYGIASNKVGERIITQMVFSEDMFMEEDIFEDYYLSDSVYFRLKQAYLAYVSREFVLKGRETGRIVFDIIIHECEKKEELPDICKIALLKYFSARDYTVDEEPVLHEVLREMCEKQLVFPCYLNFKEAWLRENQLYDKAMIEYHAKPGSRVELHYKLKQGRKEELGYHMEVMTPAYENIYVKQFILYADESISYYFKETADKERITTEKKTLSNERKTAGTGKFGRLNEMSAMSPASRKKAMLLYREEEIMAEEIYKLY
ncbi:DUF5717 family protein [[Clostridium] hylemonae]|uniref:Uncharacterized protein n=1 Tax=[Clostridium] hylemonae DSM 15053 TaxID=553973 RepID=C0C353_9FIRM|nr:hypothetical protein CLOHYLEM_06513 [[Clostridium] hylemonae DSM 15053]